MPHNPGSQSEAPLSSAGGDLFTLDAVTRVYVPPRNYERPGGVEWVKADWGTGYQATRVFSAGPMPPEPERSQSEATTCSRRNSSWNC